jgi:hypothetical protein
MIIPDYGGSTYLSSVDNYFTRQYIPEDNSEQPMKWSAIAESLKNTAVYSEMLNAEMIKCHTEVTHHFCIIKTCHVILVLTTFSCRILAMLLRQINATFVHCFTAQVSHSYQCIIYLHIIVFCVPAGTHCFNLFMIQYTVYRFIAVTPCSPFLVCLKRLLSVKFLQ